MRCNMRTIREVKVTVDCRESNFEKEMRGERTDGSRATGEYLEDNDRPESGKDCGTGIASIASSDSTSQVVSHWGASTRRNSRLLYSKQLMLPSHYCPCPAAPAEIRPLAAGSTLVIWRGTRRVIEAVRAGEGTPHCTSNCTGVGMLGDSCEESCVLGSACFVG